MAVSTWSDLIAASAKGIEVLAEVLVGEHLTAWSKTGGRTNVYEVTVTQQPAKFNRKEVSVVRVDSATATLTSVGDVATVDSTAGSYYWDSANSVLYIHTADSSAVWLHTVVADWTLYLCSGTYDGAGGTVFNSKQYWPVLGGISTITRQWDILINPKVIVGSITLRVVPGDTWDELISYGRFSGRQVSILLGGESLPYSEFKTVYTGITRNYAWTEEGIALEITDATDQLDIAIPRTKMTTANDTEDFNFVHLADPSFGPGMFTTYPASADDFTQTGTADLTPYGEPEPIVYGDRIKYQPKPINIYSDSDRATFKLATHEIAHVHALFINGDRSEWDTVGSQTVDGLALTAWVVDLQNAGLHIDENTGGAYLQGRTFEVIVSGKPDATYGFREAHQATVGQWGIETQPLIDNPADVVYDLITVEAGLADNFDTTILAESRALCSLYEVGFALTENTTLRAVIENVCRSSGSYFYTSKSGQWVFKTWFPDFRSATEISEAHGDILDFTVSWENADAYSTVAVYYGEGSEEAVDQGVTALRASESVPEFAADVPNQKELEITSTYLRNEEGAVCLARRLAQWGASRPKVYELKVPLRHADLDLGDTIKITKTRQPRSASTDTIYAQVMGLSLDIEAGTITIHANDLHIFQRQAWITGASHPAWSAATDEEKRTGGFFCNTTGEVASSDNTAYKASLEW